MKINENGYIEPEIGEVFEDKRVNANGERAMFRTVEGTCNNCFYEKRSCVQIACRSGERDDKKDVVFKQVKND